MATICTHCGEHVEERRSRRQRLRGLAARARPGRIRGLLAGGVDLDRIAGALLEDVVVCPSCGARGPWVDDTPDAYSEM
jgi:DNA-directed RNA polymerase subunit RPC12/RpoP